MVIKLIRASVDDAEIIHKLQIEAFAELLCKYQDMDTNPGNEPLEKVLWRLQQNNSYFYLIESEGNYVGAIRVIDDKTDKISKRISPLFILPQFRNKGLAQQAIIEAEKIHGCNNWELETILQEEGNCYLYEKMGYQKTGETKEINDKLTLVFYKK